LQYNFEWDPKKAALNLRKHKISFEDAAEVFLDPSAISIYDEEHSGLEDRWITLGKSSENVTLVVVHTFLEQGRNRFHIRMISARKATKKERKQYEEGGQ